jgi:hypothetical protein
MSVIHSLLSLIERHDDDTRWGRLVWDSFHLKWVQRYSTSTPYPLDITSTHVYICYAQIKMKVTTALPLLAASAAITLAASVPSSNQQQVLGAPAPAADGAERFIIETSPGVTQLVTEDEKWALRRVPLHHIPTHLALLTPSL